MLFYTQLFTSKRGPLAKIWLAAHWERKLTKAHVFDCNLETSINDIIARKRKIGLRTSGHLLLGVVRIYSRKAKYLLSDCNEALVKIKIAFRPGQTDLPIEDLEATEAAITLVEDFTSFDTQLPEPSDIDIDMIPDQFSLNQCRTEEITMKEDFGNNYLAFADFGGVSQRYNNTLLDMSFQSLTKCDDNFGDEGRTIDLFGDFLTNTAENLDLNGFMPEEPQNTAPEVLSVTRTPVVEREEPMMSETSTNNETPLLDNEEAFTLEPVETTPNRNRRRSKRRRKLVVDQFKELSDKTIKQQLIDFSDLLSPLDLAPPTQQLMQWKGNGGADKLFARLCLDVIAPEINELFTNSIFLVKYISVNEKVEEMRQRRQKSSEKSDVSVLTAMDSSVTVNPEDILHSEPTILSYITEGQKEATTQREEGQDMSEFSNIELPSEDSLFVHPSHVQQESQSTSLNTQSLLGSQDFEERRINKQAQKLLNILKLHNESNSDDTTFSLEALCRGGSRSQAATTFACLLALKKQQAVNVHQSTPYQDILVSPGPTFYS